MEPNSEIQIQTEDADDYRLIRVEGDLSLATAGDLRTTLLNCFRPGARAVLDGNGIRSIDLCGLQLLCSAHRTYLLNGAAFELKAISQTVQEAAQAAGYAPSNSVCPYRRDGNCLWKN